MVPADGNGYRIWILQVKKLKMPHEFEKLTIINLTGL